jgi:hypothetical protein
MSTKRILVSAMTAVMSLGLAACQGNLFSRMADEGLGSEAVRILSSPAEVGTAFLVDVIVGATGTFSAMWAEFDNLPPGTSFGVTVTEADVEAGINQALVTSGYSDSVHIQNVALGDGQVSLSFTLMLPPFNTDIPAKATLEPSIDDEGNLVINVVSAEFSQVQAPAESLAILNQAISEAMADVQASAQADLRLTEIVVANGEVIVSGYVE